MPTYVYKFIDTGETIEIQQSFDEDNLTQAVHPATGESMPVKKVFLPVGVTFKGDGFYKTDSRTSKKSKAGTTTSSESAGSSSSSDSGGSSTSSESSGSSSSSDGNKSGAGSAAAGSSPSSD